MLVALDKTMSQNEFRTLRGFLEGEEDEEETTFSHSATLRIFGSIPDLNEISRIIGLEPTNKHLKGERKGHRSPPYESDMWSYTAPVPEGEPLHIHIDDLWSKIRSKKEYLLELKRNLDIDIFLGYRSNHDYAGVEVPHTSL